MPVVIGINNPLTIAGSIQAGVDIQEHTMKRILFILPLLMLAVLVGCGDKSHKSMKIKEIMVLPEAEQQAIEKELTADEQKWLMQGSAKHASDTNALKEKTLGELIEEGKSAPTLPQ